MPHSKVKSRIFHKVIGRTVYYERVITTRLSRTYESSWRVNSLKIKYTKNKVENSVSARYYRMVKVSLVTLNVPGEVVGKVISSSPLPLFRINFRNFILSES